MLPQFQPACVRLLTFLLTYHLINLPSLLSYLVSEAVLCGAAFDGM